MNSLKNLTVATWLLLLSATPSLAMQIISPADNDVVSSATRLVLKGGDKPVIDAVTISVNGEKSDLLDISSAAYRQSFRDFVFLEIAYDSGVNQIEVEGYAGGKRVAGAKSRVYLPTGVMEPPEPFTEQRFHTPEREAQCTGCHHNLNPTAKDLANPVPGQNPCSTCHQGVLAGKQVHGPAGVYDCTGCHDLTSKPDKYRVPDNEGQFCLDCHDDVAATLKKRAHVHGPVAAGLCLSCHNPHSSDAPGLVRGPGINASCLECHPKVAGNVHVVRAVGGGGHKLEGPKDPSRPQKAFHCASCHDPHAGVVSTLLSREATSSMALCRQCHQK